MLTETELSQLRNDVLETLTDTVDIKRKSISVSSSGMTSETFSTIVSGAKARVDPERSSRSDVDLVAEREAGRMAFIVTVGYNTDIEVGDRVIFGGETLDVLQVYLQHSDRAVRRARAVLIV